MQWARLADAYLMSSACASVMASDAMLHGGFPRHTRAAPGAKINSIYRVEVIETRQAAKRCNGKRWVRRERS
jgi:hypothetical protein